MTEGYVALKRGNGIIVPFYSAGNSYLSHLGYCLLLRMKDNTLASYIEKRNERQITGHGEDCDPIRLANFSLSWIRKDANNALDSEYAEFGYIYDEARDTLGVYHFGDSLFTVNKDTIDKWIFACKNGAELKRLLSYDARRLQFDTNFKKVCAKLRKLSLPQLQKMFECRPAEYILLESVSKFSTGVNAQRGYVAQYALQFIHEDGNDQKTDIYLSESYRVWKAHIQLPYMRTCFPIGTFRSKGSLLKDLTIFARTYKDKIKRFCEIYETVNKFGLRCGRAHYDLAQLQYLRNDALNQLENELNRDWKQKPWLTFPDASENIVRFSVEDIVSHYRKELDDQIQVQLIREEMKE